MTINITKAQEITKERLRQERKPLLEALDIEVIKNISNTTKLQEIEAEKQRLRNITSSIDLITDLEELKQITII